LPSDGFANTLPGNDPIKIIDPVPSIEPTISLGPSDFPSLALSDADFNTIEFDPITIENVDVSTSGKVLTDQAKIHLLKEFPVI
jgi:hypothetical protein